jgi:hypothetical protein
VDEGLVEAVVDFAPQAADVNVDDVGARVEMIFPHAFEHHRARDDLVLVAQQIFEQAELARLQVDAFAGARQRGG